MVPNRRFRRAGNHAISSLSGGVSFSLSGRNSQLIVIAPLTGFTSAATVLSSMLSLISSSFHGSAVNLSVRSTWPSGLLTQ